MSKIYLRRVKGGDCKDCHMAQTNKCNKPFNMFGDHSICSYNDIVYKKISERTAKKLLKSGKCKIVNSPK